MIQYLNAHHHSLELNKIAPFSRTIIIIVHSDLTVHHFSSELASGIVSTALQCGSEMFPTDDLQLDTPVRIIIEHSDTVKVGQYVLCCWCSWLLLWL